MKRIVLLVIFVFVLAIVTMSLFRLNAKKAVIKDGRINVVASFYPLAHFSEQILGDLGVITLLTPPGSDAHSFSPTPADAVALNNADIFFFNGAGFDEHIIDFVNSLQADGLRIVDMSQFVQLLPANQEQLDEDGDHHREFDPHYWQSIRNDKVMIEALRDIFLDLAANDLEKDRLIQNTDWYLTELTNLDQEYSEGLNNCRLSDIVVAHDAFTYLANDYGFNLIPIAGLSPQDKPSAQRLGELSDLVRQRDLKHIYFETLSSPELSETLAREVGAETLVLNPLEGLTPKEIASGENYVTVMKENLDNLRIGLDCK